MKTDPFETCGKCGRAMKRISEGDQRPLIMECPVCQHREYTEIQTPPPWPPAEDSRDFDPSGGIPVRNHVNREKEFRSKMDSSGTPTSVGVPDEEGKVIPVGWILTGLILVLIFLALILWLV